MPITASKDRVDKMTDMVDALAFYFVFVFSVTCHEAAHARRGEAARWIDSRNRSLPPVEPPTPGGGGLSEELPT